MLAYRGTDQYLLNKVAPASIRPSRDSGLSMRIFFLTKSSRGPEGQKPVVTVTLTLTVCS